MRAQKIGHRDSKHMVQHSENSRIVRKTHISNLVSFRARMKKVIVILQFPTKRRNSQECKLRKTKEERWCLSHMVSSPYRLIYGQGAQKVSNIASINTNDSILTFNVASGQSSISTH